MRAPFPTAAVCLLVLPLSDLRAQDAPSRRDTLDRATRNLGDQQQKECAATGMPLPPQASAGALRLIDISLDVVAAAGTSTERDAVLGDLQGGAHDPKKRGFTLEQAELTFAGAVDPWFEARAAVVASLDTEQGETIVELEEAFLTTLQLPADLQLKAGTFFTEFGRINPTHPHAWDWQSQPIIHTRLFGGDGMRGPGARLSWLLPTPTYAELFFGVQNANGETMVSFLANDEVYSERPIGGRQFQEREVRAANDIVYTMRAATSFELSDYSSLGLGASALFGPNPTGGDADTAVWGVDFVWRWRPSDNHGGVPFVKLQGEFLGRAFDAAAQVDASDPLNPVAIPETTLHDYGGYLQALYGFTPQWAAGLRGEWASGSGDSYAGGGTFDRDSDPFRCDRVRVSPMLAYKPSEFSRIRLQYDYDDSDQLPSRVHSVWLGFEVLIGAHPPHAY